MTLPRVAIFAALFTVPSFLSFSAIPAFPGAEGYGAYAAGGRGGDVYHVTNLNASGAGSFADAIATVPAAGRTIVFDVSGYIRFPSGSNGVRMTASKVTIAGQTAPGDGVGFTNNFFRISGDDVVVRHLRFRMGKNGSGGDCVDLDSGTLNAILDHVSMQFSTDENMSSFGSPPENLTLQYSLNAWGLESHSCGGLWDQNHATSHHNLWAHNHTRNPKSRPGGLLEWVNNVTFDWDIGFIMGDSESVQNWKANVINNYFICPPTNLQSKALVKGTVATNNLPNFTVFLGGNLTDNNGDGILNGTDKGYSIVEGSVYSASETPAAAPGAYRYYQAASAITGSTAGVTTDAPLLAYKKVVSNAGALRLDSNYTGPLRDEVDTILLGKLTSQTAFHITRESSTGASASGFGVLASTSAPLDTDRDGMPDYWETALGFNLAVDDHNTVFASSGGVITGTTFFPANTPAGYTRLEEYLQFLAIPHGIVAKNTDTPTSSITIDLRKFTSGFVNATVFALSNLVGGTATQSGSGGYLVTFTPTVGSQGRARFEFTVTDADGSTWTQTYALLVSNSALPRDIVWKGDGTTNTWDETVANWLRNGAATAYGAGDRVTFDDTGSHTPAVALASALTPGSVDVKTGLGYTFGGAGTISSTGPLTKSGAGTLTLATNNAYAGGILLQEGAITLNGAGGLSGGKLSMQDGTSVTNALATGNTSAIGNPIDISTGQSATLNSGNRLVWSGALTGAGTLNLVVQTTVTRFDIKGATNAFAGNVVFSGSGGVRLYTNGGSFNGFDASTVNLGGSVGLYPQTNSGGNSYAIGALTGASSSAVLGGGSAGAPAYSIGGLNQNNTFAGSISGNAVLIKTGSGTLTLGGASTYTGATTVSTGSLVVAGSLGNTPVTVANGAVLAGSGTLGGAVTASAGGILSPGTAPFTGSTMTVGGGLSLNGNTLYFDMSNSPAGANDKIVLNGGALTMSGTQYFQFLLLQSTLAAGTYDLVTGAATISASGFTLTHNLPTGGRQTFTLAPVGTTLRLTVTGSPATLTWTGAASGNWDTTTASNFSGATPSTFGSNDAVVFDDSSAATSILIPSPVTPRSTLVNNTTKAFTIAGGINGGSLTKSGTNTLTLTGTNTYAGGTFLNAGTIILANDNANSTGLGTGPVTFANGTTLTMYNNVSGDNTAAWGMIVPAAVTATLNADSRVTLSGSLTGGGTLNMWIPYIRTTITGDWSAFTGTINVSTDGDGGDFRFGTNYAYAGFPSAAIILPGKVAMYYIGILAAGAGTTISIGELSGAASATLLGGPTGGRALTYRIGSRNTDATFAGTIGEQGGIGSGNITSYVKTGTGTWTLSGTCAYNGGTTVEQGTLRILGFLTSNGGQLDVAAAATLNLSGGTLTVDSTNIAASAQLIGNGTINGDLNNNGSTSSSTGGTLTITGSVVNTGSMVLTNGSKLQIDGDMVNNGTLSLTAGGQLTGAGSVENDGIIDMMTGLQTLPANFVNNGIVLDSSKVATAGYSLSGTSFTVSVKGYTGHNYQLQKTASLAANSWQNVGSPQPGIGALTGSGVQLDLVDAGSAGAKSFYRVVVTP